MFENIGSYLTSRFIMFINICDQPRRITYYLTILYEYTTLQNINWYYNIFCMYILIIWL